MSSKFLSNISIGRYEDDPQAQGIVKPADGRWQLIIDKDGYPHLYVQVNVELDDGTMSKNMLALDYMLIDKMSIKDLMDGGNFFGKLSPEEEAEAYAEHVADCEARSIPCPR